VWEDWVEGLLHVYDALLPSKCIVLTTLGFCHEHALILYVYLPNEHSEEESVLTVCFRPDSTCLTSADV
jgi:hypothetical protein